MVDNAEYSGLEHSLLRGFTLYATGGKDSSEKLIADQHTSFDLRIVDDDYVHESIEGTVRAGFLERYYSTSANAVAYVLVVTRYVVSNKEIAALYRKEVEEIEKVEAKKLSRERKVGIKERLTNAAYNKARESNLVETSSVPVIVANNMLVIFSRNKVVLEMCVSYLREQSLTNGAVTFGLDDNSHYFYPYKEITNNEVHAATSGTFRQAVINGTLSITSKRFALPFKLDVIGLAGTGGGNRVVATSVYQHILEQVAADTVIDKIKVCPIYWLHNDVQLNEFDISGDLTVGGSGTLHIGNYVGADGVKGVFVHEIDSNSNAVVKHDVDVIEAVVMLFNSVYFTQISK